MLMQPTSKDNLSCNYRPHEKMTGVSPRRPCAVCGRLKSCSRGDGGLLMCFGQSGEVPGFVLLGPAAGNPGFTLYRRIGDDRSYASAGSTPAQGVPTPLAERADDTPKDWGPVARSYAAMLRPDDRLYIARRLGVPLSVIDPVPLLGSPGRNAFGSIIAMPEFDGDGGVIGLCERTPGPDKDTKESPYGARRGLAMYPDLADTTGTIYVVEGWSDVIAMRSVGLPAVGRPSNMGGADHLARLFKKHPGREIVVVGENDKRFNSANGQEEWPGRDGMVHVASKLAASLGRPVLQSLPPDGAKDARAYINARVGPDSSEAERLKVGEELAAELMGSAERVEAPPVDDLTDLVAELTAQPATAELVGSTAEGELAAPAPPPPQVIATLVSLAPPAPVIDKAAAMDELVGRYSGLRRYCRGRPVLMRSKTTRQVKLIYFPNRTWTCCASCHLAHREQKLNHCYQCVAHVDIGRLEGNGTEGCLWVLRRRHVPRLDSEGRDRVFEAIRQSIYVHADRRGAKADYLRRYTDQDGELCIVSTDRWDCGPGFKVPEGYEPQPMTPADAYRVMAECITSIPPRGKVSRPLTGSRTVLIERGSVSEDLLLVGWKPPSLRTDGKQDLEHVNEGERPECTDAEFAEAMSAEGAELKSTFDHRYDVASASTSDIRKLIAWGVPTTGVYAGLGDREASRLLVYRVYTRLRGVNPDMPFNLPDPAADGTFDPLDLLRELTGSTG
jgi:hypothetical protein